jgi:quercetin dioxygenase-like cupin family protein
MTKGGRGCIIFLYLHQQKKYRMKETAAFQFENEIPWEDAGHGVMRQVYGYNNQIMLVKARFETGGIGPEHKHPHVQVTYVASGVFELTIGGNKRLLKAGDGYYVAPDTLHSCICVEEGLLIDAFSPAREDFVS